MDKLEASERQARLMEAAMAVLDGAPKRQLNAVSINKALFYLDLFALRDTGETVTGSAYIALDMGPVVAHYPKRVIKKLEKLGLAEQRAGAHGAKPICAVAPMPPTRWLNDHLLNIARKLGATFGNHTSSAASEFSHENVGWRLAYDTGLGGGALPTSIDLLVAMQQLPAEDDWLEQGTPPDMWSSLNNSESWQAY